MTQGSITKRSPVDWGPEIEFRSMNIAPNTTIRSHQQDNNALYSLIWDFFGILRQLQI
jgi:hypothetical protein